LVKPDIKHTELNHVKINPMKKVIFSLFFFSFLIVGAQAQSTSCSKTCTKSAASSTSCAAKAPSVAMNADGCHSTAAAKVASLDNTIEKRTDPVTGNVSYVRKETSAKDGAVTFVDVMFDATTNTFVNVSPVKMEGSGCSKASAGKACCASKGKAAEKVKS
jgi:hypothetical protein